MKSLSLFTFTLAALALQPSSARADEKRLVGYASGRPLYVTAASRPAYVAPAPNARVLTALATRPTMTVRPMVYRTVAPQVNMGASRCIHGGSFAPAYGDAGGAWGWGSGDDYGGYGYGYGNNGGQRPCYAGHGITPYCHPAPYVHPYPAAAKLGYAWIPRYGGAGF